MQKDALVWTKLERRAESDYSCWFWKFASLTVFQTSFYGCFVAFEIRLGKYVCLTRSCDFVIHRKYKLKDERLQTKKMN